MVRREGKPKERDECCCSSSSSLGWLEDMDGLYVCDRFVPSFVRSFVRRFRRARAISLLSRASGPSIRPTVDRSFVHSVVPAVGPSVLARFRSFVRCVRANSVPSV